MLKLKRLRTIKKTHHCAGIHFAIDCFSDLHGAEIVVVSMKNMERSVNDGLVALATSDMFLCLVYFITSLYWKKTHFDSLLELYYRTYEGALINFFLLTR